MRFEEKVIATIIRNHCKEGTIFTLSDLVNNFPYLDKVVDGYYFGGRFNPTAINRLIMNDIIKNRTKGLIIIPNKNGYYLRKILDK